MSARQLQRLRNLVKASTGADNDDDDDDTEAYPLTMKVPKGVRKTKRLQKIAGPQVQDSDDAQLIQQQQQASEQTSASTGKEPQKREGNKSEDVWSKTEETSVVERTKLTDSEKRNKKENAKTDSGHQKERREEGGKKKQHKRKDKAKRLQIEREEELLLEEALKQREEDARIGGEAYNATGLLNEEADLLELLSICNTKLLDTRQERIRRFGVKAVEDIGDGKVPRRRTENRATALLFAEHLNFTPRFFHSILATPNRYCWPQYDSLGVSLALKDGSDDTENSSNGSLVYYLDNFTSEARRADIALALCESLHGGVEGVMARLGVTPYHIPTLIIASNMFETMGNNPRAQETIDIALYHVGVLLSRFPVRQTVRRRRLPFSIASNRQIFQILRCGVHQALKKAATRAALEIAKLIYSLDDTDPLGMLLLLDYLALRSSQWAWLLQLYFLMTQELQYDTAGSGDDISDKWSNHTLALGMSTLPGYFFSAALAKHFLEREEAVYLDNAGAGKGKLSKVLREMTPNQLYAFRNTPPASEMLADAIGRFPSAAVLLAEKVGIHSLLLSASRPWQEILKVHTSSEKVDKLHIVELWVARNADMWKAGEQKKFLQNVITEDDGRWLKSCSFSAVDVVPLHHLTLWQHALLSEKDLMGQTITAIPEHLLDAVESTEEDMRDEVRRATLRELTSSEQVTLLRFRALYGPLSPSTLSPAQELARYGEIFDEEGRERNIGQEHNPFSLFFRTFLPWNSTRDMALRAALEAAGIPDPIIDYNNSLRVEDERFWQAQEEVNGEEEEEWETEDSWYDSDFLVDDVEEEDEPHGGL